MTLRPLVGVGAIVVHEDAILLVRRGKPPHSGLWAIPGGRLRYGETLASGAEREIREETGVRIRGGEVIYTTEYIEEGVGGDDGYHYVIVDVAGEYIDGAPRGDDDALEASWIRFDQLPTLPLNPTTHRALGILFPGQLPADWLSRAPRAAAG